MNIKNLLLLTLFMLCSCQPEQTKWPENKSIKKSTPGQVIFEALSNNIAQQGECGPQRDTILRNKKHLFIKKLDALLNSLSDGNQTEKSRSLAAFIKSNESTEKIKEAADFIERNSAHIAKLDLKNLKEILSADDRALERLLLYIIHSKDLESLLAELADPAKSDLSMMQLISKFQTIADQMPAQVDFHKIAQKAVKLIDDSSEHKKLALKVVGLLGKFADPARKKAALELKNIMTKVYPEITVEDMVTWIGMLKTVPSSLGWGPTTTRIATKIGGIFANLPGFLPDFIDRITADDKIYYSVMGNTKILYDAGIFDDILDLAPEADKMKQVVKKEYLDDLKSILIFARKLFVLDESILEAPAVIIAKILLEVLATNKESECRRPNKQGDLSTTIENWAKSLVAFMRDSKKGLPHILSLIRYNL